MHLNTDVNVHIIILIILWIHHVWLIVTNIYVTRESHRRIASENDTNIGQVLESTTLGAQTTIGTPLHLGSLGHGKIQDAADWNRPMNVWPWCMLMLDWANAMQTSTELLIGGWLEHEWIIFLHNILGMWSSQLLLTPSFFRGVGQPPTRLLLTTINLLITINNNH